MDNEQPRLPAPLAAAIQAQEHLLERLRVQYRLGLGVGLGQRELFNDLADFVECTSSPFYVPIDTPSYSPDLIDEYITEMWWILGSLRKTFYEIACSRIERVRAEARGECEEGVRQDQGDYQQASPDQGARDQATTQTC